MYVITGRRGEGKTACLARVLDIYGRRGLILGGVITVSAADKQFAVKREFSIRALRTGETRLLMTDVERDRFTRRVGKYFMNQDVMDWASKQIVTDAQIADVVAVDEIGLMELRGKGYADTVRMLLGNYTGIKVFVIRENNIAAFTETFSVDPAKLRVIHCSVTTDELESVLA